MSIVFYAISDTDDEKVFEPEQCYSTKNYAVSNKCNNINAKEVMLKEELYPYGCYLYETDINGTVLSSKEITIHKNKAIDESSYLLEEIKDKTIIKYDDVFKATYMIKDLLKDNELFSYIKFRDIESDDGGCSLLDILDGSKTKDIMKFIDDNLNTIEPGLKSRTSGGILSIAADYENNYVVESSNEKNKQSVLDNINIALEKEELKCHISSSSLKKFLDSTDESLCLGSFKKEDYEKAYKIIKASIPDDYKVSKDNYFTIFIRQKESTNESIVEATSISNDIYKRYEHYIKWCRMDDGRYCSVNAILPIETEKGILFATARLNEKDALSVLKNLNDNNTVNRSDSDGYFSVTVTMEPDKDGVAMYYAHTEECPCEDITNESTVLGGEFIEESAEIIDNDYYYNYDKFGSTFNVLLVTGLSGSGKSTLAKSIASKTKSIHIELDLITRYKDDSTVPDVIKEFYNTKLMKSYKEKLLNKQVKFNDYRIIFSNFLRFAKSFVKNNNCKLVVEGVQIYNCFKYDEISSYPLIITGTSALKSLARKYKRSFSNMSEEPDEFWNDVKNIKNVIKWYWDENKSLNDFKGEINESYIDGEFIEESDYISETLETKLTRPFIDSKVTLYHGSIEKFNIIEPMTNNIGTRVSSVRKSSFWTIDKNGAVLFAVGNLLKSKNRDILSVFDLSTMKLLIDSKSKSKVISLLSVNCAYLYEVTVDSKIVGRGHNRELNEYTLDRPVKPDKIYKLFYNNYKDMIEFVTDSVINNMLINIKKNLKGVDNSNVLDRLVYHSPEETRNIRKDLKNSLKGNIEEIDINELDRLEESTLNESSIGITLAVIKNIWINAMKSGRWEDIRPNLIKILEKTNKPESLDNLLKDAYSGARQLTSFANQFNDYPKEIKETEKLLQKEPNNYKLINKKIAMEKFLKDYKNNSYDKVMEHVKWLKETYIPMIKDKKKKLLTESCSILETKEFPVDFDEQGNIIIKNYKKLNFEAEYSASHKLLKIYNDTNSIDGMKYELSKLWFMNNVLEKRIYSNPTEKELIEYSKVRARILNDFNTYLKVVMETDRNFNFTTYYNDSPFSDVKIKISGSLVKGLADLLKQAL